MPPLLNTPATTPVPPTAPPMPPGTPDANPRGASTARKPLTDPVLEQIVQQTEDKVKTLSPQLQDAYQRIVTPGMKILYTPQTHQMERQGIAKITGPQDVPNAVAQGVAKIISTLYQASQRKMSIPMSIPAATTLACYILDDIAHIKGIPMTPDLVAQTTQAVVQKLYALYQISPQQVQQAIDAGKAKQGQGGKTPAPVPPTPAANPVPMQGGA